MPLTNTKFSWAGITPTSAPQKPLTFIPIKPTEFATRMEKFRQQLIQAFEPHQAFIEPNLYAELMIQLENKNPASGGTRSKRPDSTTRFWLHIPDEAEVERFGKASQTDPLPVEPVSISLALDALKLISNQMTIQEFLGRQSRNETLQFSKRLIAFTQPIKRKSFVTDFNPEYPETVVSGPRLIWCPPSTWTDPSLLISCSGRWMLSDGIQLFPTAIPIHDQVNFARMAKRIRHWQRSQNKFRIAAHDTLTSLIAHKKFSSKSDPSGLNFGETILALLGPYLKVPERDLFLERLEEVQLHPYVENRIDTAQDFVESCLQSLIRYLLTKCPVSMAQSKRVNRSIWVEQQNAQQRYASEWRKRYTRRLRRTREGWSPSLAPELFLQEPPRQEPSLRCSRSSDQFTAEYLARIDE